MTSTKVLCTVAVGPHRELWSITRPTFERYAIRHGYDLVCVANEQHAEGRPPAWTKLVLVDELLERYETVVWVDADAVFVDFDDDIIGHLDRRHAVHLVWHEFDDVVIPNSGVFVAQRSASTTRLLRRVWSRVEFTHHRWWENAALIAEIGGDGNLGLVDARQRQIARGHIGRLDHRWNSIPSCPAPSAAIVHFAGIEHEMRCAQMRDLVVSTAR